MVIAYKHLAQIHWTPFRRNRPEDIGEVFAAESRGLPEVVKFHLDFNVALLALYLGFAARGGHKICACEVDFCGPTAMLIVDCFYRAAGHAYGEGWQ
jgi:hypothetical protein